jgi:diphthine-ammonia ligase
MLFLIILLGAIASNYQRLRVENVCERLHLRSMTYLWMRNQQDLLNEMIEYGVNAILVKVAGVGLSPEKHLGRSISVMQKQLLFWNEKFGLSPVGEGRNTVISSF